MANQLWTYGFPDSYATVINAASAIKYVSTSGSNSNNGNSIATAYKTIAYAVSANSGTATSITIVILAGTYVEVPITAGSSYATAVLTDGNKPRVFVCCPGQVKIQFSDASMGYGPYIANFQNSGSAVYGAIFERNNGGRATNYMVALFCGSNTVGNLEGNFYNCAFTEVNANNAWSLQYDNEFNITSQVNNCTFKFGAAGLADYNGSTGLVLNSSVFNTASPTSGSTKNSTLFSQTVSTTYVTTGVTTAGVYSGAYAWNSATSPPEPGLYSSVTTAYSGTPFTITLSTSGVANGTQVPYTVSGVTTGQISGASLTGNFTINGNVASANFTPLITNVATPTFSMSSNTYTVNVTLSAYYSITAPVIIETIYPAIPNPLPGQLNIPHMGANAISDPTLQRDAVTKTILSSSYLANKVIVPVVTTTTKTNGPLTVYIVKPMGDNPNREYWL